MSSRLITIGCLQMGKARRSGNLHLNPFRPTPTLTNPQHGARPKEASWTIGFPGSSHQQLLFNLHCAAPQSYCKFFGNGFSVAPVNELYDTDASGYLCPGRSTRVGPNLFYLILPAKKILLCSACRSPKTCKLGLEHTAIVRDTPVATCKDASCSATLACTVCSVPGRFPPCFGLTFVFHTSERGTQTHLQHSPQSK